MEALTGMSRVACIGCTTTPACSGCTKPTQNNLLMCGTCGTLQAEAARHTHKPPVPHSACGTLLFAQKTQHSQLQTEDVGKGEGLEQMAIILLLHVHNAPMEHQVISGEKQQRDTPSQAPALRDTAMGSADVTTGKAHLRQRVPTRG